MKTSLSELQLIEKYILSSATPEDKLIMDAKFLLNPALQESLYWQQKTYRLVETYGREELRKEISQVHQKLFTAPEYLSFKDRIMRFFRK